MTRKEALRECLTLRGKISTAYILEDYTRRDKLCKIHDALMLAVLTGQEIPELATYGNSHILKAAA